jgi:hypothetical protein
VSDVQCLWLRVSYSGIRIRTLARSRTSKHKEHSRIRSRGGCCLTRCSPGSQKVRKPARPPHLSGSSSVDVAAYSHPHHHRSPRLPLPSLAVDLGVDSKFQNVQRVEQARHLRETAGSSQQGRGQKDPVAQGDGFLNYGRARFLTSSVQDKRAMGSSKGVVNVPGQELSDHTATFEAAKKKAFDRGVVDSATYSAHPEKVVARGRGRHRDGASDDQAVNKFRKKTRRY